MRILAYILVFSMVAFVSAVAMALALTAFMTFLLWELPTGFVFTGFAIRLFIFFGVALSTMFVISGECDECIDNFTDALGGNRK